MAAFDNQPLLTRLHIRSYLIHKPKAAGLLGRNEDILWFEDGSGKREFLHPLAAPRRLAPNGSPQVITRNTSISIPPSSTSSPRILTADG